MNNVKDSAPQEEILKLPLFQGYGIEIEYMIVDKDSLDILPITDKLMHALSGTYEDEIERGEISWSNELALHVLEFKTKGPVKTLEKLPTLFLDQVKDANEILKKFNARLMPTAMHPWMDPHKEMKLWPHAHNPIYESYHRIFDCRGHGWANLQSTHINLPFSNDAEFAKLHAAIRVLLPIMPAIASSSPIINKEVTPFLDTRLNVYLHNARAIPSITGKGIPEVARSRREYEENILNPMYRDIAPLDPDKILQFEWLNSRGAIARFDRYTIEIRILDVQECPTADIAIAHAIVDVLKALTAEKWVSIDHLNAIDIDELYTIFLETIKEGENAKIHHPDFLHAFGMKGSTTTCELWSHLIKMLWHDKGVHHSHLHQAFDVILKQGPLARRIKNRWKKKPTPEHLKEIYRSLCDCLADDKMFLT